MPIHLLLVEQQHHHHHHQHYRQHRPHHNHQPSSPNYPVSFCVCVCVYKYHVRPGVCLSHRLCVNNSNSSVLLAVFVGLSIGLAVVCPWVYPYTSSSVVQQTDKKRSDWFTCSFHWCCCCRRRRCSAYSTVLWLIGILIWLPYVLRFWVQLCECNSTSHT